MKLKLFATENHHNNIRKKGTKPPFLFIYVGAWKILVFSHVLENHIYNIYYLK